MYRTFIKRASEQKVYSVEKPYETLTTPNHQKTRLQGYQQLILVRRHEKKKFEGPQGGDKGPDQSSNSFK